MKFLGAIILMGVFIGSAEAGLWPKKWDQLNENFVKGVPHIKAIFPPEEAKVGIGSPDQRVWEEISRREAVIRKGGR